MGKFKEMEIEAQDAVITDDHIPMYELMPKNEPTNADLRDMQLREAIMLVKVAKAQIEGMLFRNKYYDTPYTAEDIEAILDTVKDLRRTLE